MDRRLFKCKCTCGSMFDTFSELAQHVRKRRSKKHRLLVKREPLAKFIERGEISLCSRGGAAGAQAGAGRNCVTRSI